MAKRPVFRVHVKPVPWLEEVEVQFVWVAGLSCSQKKGRIQELHRSTRDKFPGGRILEISSNSTQEIGRRLSAFNLKLVYGGEEYSVESLFQGSKVFSGDSDDCGPFTSLYRKSGREARRWLRTKMEKWSANARIIRFEFDLRKEGDGCRMWPASTGTAFYDWLYISALLDHRNDDLSKKILEFDLFTDIEFNPRRSMNCQARAAALYRVLMKERCSRESLRQLVQNRDAFVEAHRKASSSCATRWVEQTEHPFGSGS